MSRADRVRTGPCTKTDAKSRLRQAEAYVMVAQLCLDDGVMRQHRALLRRWQCWLLLPLAMPPAAIDLVRGQERRTTARQWPRSSARS